MIVTPASAVRRRGGNRTPSQGLAPSLRLRTAVARIADSSPWQEATVSLTAERSHTGRELDETSGTLLRRNVYYSLSWNPSSETAAWLRELEQREQRRLGRFDSWSPSWTAARSLVVARARQGDKEPLRHFIRTALSSDACQAASLNYWAYWIGETAETYSSDEFMAGDLGPWSGAALLRRFAANLVAAEPLADLYAHSLWALLERRGRLLEGDWQLGRVLAGRVEALLAEGELSAQSRRELEQVHYGVRLLQRSLPTGGHGGR